METDFGKHLVAQFDVHDKNGDGKMKLEQIHDLLEKNGFLKHQAKKFVDKDNANKNGIMTTADFEKAVSGIPKCKIGEASFRYNMQKADTQKCGKVDKKDLEKFAGIFSNLTGVSVQAWIKKNEKDGKVEYEAFIKEMTYNNQK